MKDQSLSLNSIFIGKSPGKRTTRINLVLIIIYHPNNVNQVEFIFNPLLSTSANVEGNQQNMQENEDHYLGQLDDIGREEGNFQDENITLLLM